MASIPSTPRGRFGWVMYDWSAQPFFTIILTFIFGPYFVNAVAANPQEGQTLWANAQTFAGLAMALTAPFLGAYADESGPRKPWVIGFSLLCIFSCFGLWFAEPNASDVAIYLVIACFILGLIGAEYAVVFNNAMLPDLASPGKLGKLSGYGWAMGYVGALLALPIMLWLTGQLPGVTGPELDHTARVGDRLAGPFTAVWLALFMLPFVFWTPDTKLVVTDRLGAAKRSLAKTVTTLKELPGRPNLLRYLIARMLYYDGLNAVFAFGGVYASLRFGWGTTELGIFGIIILIFGIPGCFLGGWLDDKIGPRRTLQIFVVGITLAMTAILSIGDGKVAFVIEAAFPAEGDGLFASQAELFMVGAAALVGVCAGPVQSSSRALIAVLAPAGQAGKYFGLFALSGKATSFAAPLGIGILLGVAGDRWAYGIIVVFLLAGLALLTGVREQKETA